MCDYGHRWRMFVSFCGLPRVCWLIVQIDLAKKTNPLSFSDQSNDTQNRLTAKSGAPFSGPMFNNGLDAPATGDKRKRATDNSVEQTKSTNGVIGSSINNDSSLCQGKELHTPQQPLAKRQKVDEKDSENATAQSLSARDQDTPFDTAVTGESRPTPQWRSLSPTLPEDETELRCNLTTEINVQRLRHRNLNGQCLRKIMKLLLKSKAERSSIEAAGLQSHDQWVELEEDDLMEQAAVKLEKGGRCSRALLSRFENFLYGPFMSTEEKRTQERVICAEECISSMHTPPATESHLRILLRRLETVTLDPAAYGLNEKHPHLESLRNELISAIPVNAKPSRPLYKKFAEFLDPAGDIINASIESEVGKVKTSSSTRKVPSSTILPSTIISPSSPSYSTPARSSRPSLDLNDPSGDSMASPFLKPKIPTKRPASSDRLFSGRSVSPTIQHKTKTRDESASGSANPSTSLAKAPRPAAPAPKPSASDSINATALLSASSGSNQLSSGFTKRLFKIFVTKQAHILPVLNLNELQAAFDLAVNQGQLGPNVVDPTIGLCLAIACHLTRDKDLWRPRDWYDPAISKINAIQMSKPSLEFFHREILRAEYHHIVGDLGTAWEVVCIAIAKAQSRWMQGINGGDLAVDPQSLEQVRLIWHLLSTKRASLAFQLGIYQQSGAGILVRDTPMPKRSHIESNIEAHSMSSHSQVLASSAFFLACASLYTFSDDLVTVEHDLRVTRKECPMKWLSIVDLCDFQDLQRKLSSWKRGLPACFEWKESEIDLGMEKNPQIRRMRLILHLRHLYFLLREYRPFFILNLRLSTACTCEMTPHVPGENVHAVNAEPILALVHSNAIKCITAAQMIVKTLSGSFVKEHDDDAKCENLEYLHAAALVLVAALGMSHRSAQHGDTTRSATTLVEQFRQAEKLMRNYEECCVMAPKLKQRIRRCRDFLGVLEYQSNPGSSKHARIIMDDSLRFDPIVWRRIYDRLDLDIPFERFPKPSLPSGSTAIGRRLTFGWLESLPVDIDLKAT
jgi:hypothetical protein